MMEQSDTRCRGSREAVVGPWKRAWPWLRRVLTLAFFGLLAWLLSEFFKEVELSEVWATLRAYPVEALLMAGALSLLSFLFYGCFDLVGRHYDAQPKLVSAPRTVQIGFTSFAFNLNLGALMGGLAFRYRLYSRLGVSETAITRIVGMSMLTNWLGYLLVGGVIFASGVIKLPADWEISAFALRGVGFSFLIGCGMYLLLCRFSKRRTWAFKNHEFTLPEWPVALIQLFVSSLHWLFMGAVIYTLLRGAVSFPVAFGTLLISSIAAVIVHVPAGLGVLETVFVTLLGSTMPHHSVLAAVLAYRAVFHLIPFLIALLLYVHLEVLARRATQ